MFLDLECGDFFVEVVEFFVEPQFDIVADGIVEEDRRDDEPGDTEE